ncbi:MAG: carbohydrate-binding family 9-like protein [Verrucomicrobiae bacterium]|nr:carbohydrate-binding family 9-like protein [Verrucomicrobiae bacterium]
MIFLGAIAIACLIGVFGMAEHHIMIKQMVFLIIAFWITASCLASDVRRIYPCYRLTQTPALDGRLDDVSWKKIPESMGFYMCSGTGKKFAMKNQTSFKAGWTQEALYFAIRAEDSAPEQVISKKKHAKIWQDDSVELFFLPPGAQSYAHLAANCTGGRFFGHGKKNMDWEARFSIGSQEWFMEWRVPFRVLMDNPPSEGQEWLVNVGRNIPAGPVEERFTCWPLLKKGFHDAEHFGIFVFKKNPGEQVREEEREINRAYMNYMKEEIGKLAGIAKKHINDLMEIRKIRGPCEEVEKMLKAWDQALAITAQATTDLQKLSLVFRECVDLKSKSRNCLGRERLEILFNEN